MSRAKHRTCPLSEHVRVQFKQIRKMKDITQEEFASKLGIQRAAYTKKETGESPYALCEIDELIRHYGIGLGEIFRGYEGFVFDETEKHGLTEHAREKFPFLDQAIQIANNLTNKQDHDFLIATLKYGLSKMEDCGEKPLAVKLVPKWWDGNGHGNGHKLRK